MGRGKDLTFNERTTVHGLIKNYDMNQFKRGGRFLLPPECKRGVLVKMLPLVSSIPFSDHHNPNELPRLPSPNHGDVACWDASVSILLDIGGARLIRDFGGIINA